MADILVRNVPQTLNIRGEVIFSDLIEILNKNYFFDIDFKEVENKNISLSMVDWIKEMKDEIKKNWLKNFTSISSS